MSRCSRRHAGVSWCDVCQPRGAAGPQTMLQLRDNSALLTCPCSGRLPYAPPPSRSPRHEHAYHLVAQEGQVGLLQGGAQPWAAVQQHLAQGCGVRESVSAMTTMHNVVANDPGLLMIRGGDSRQVR